MRRSDIYGFAMGSTGRLLYLLKNIDCCYLVFPNNITHYLEMLLHDQPTYILGLGSYSGIDQDRIRIETCCSNKFRNDFLEGDSYREMGIQPFLKPTLAAKTAGGIGNSYCNMVSWRIVQLIAQKKLQARYSFLHVPKKIKPWSVSQEIDLMLREFR